MSEPQEGQFRMFGSKFYVIASERTKDTEASSDDLSQHSEGRTLILSFYFQERHLQDCRTLELKNLFAVFVVG